MVVMLAAIVIDGAGGAAITSTSMVVVAPHCPASGVKVYITIPDTLVFMDEGLQVPVMAGMLFELLGKLGAAAP